MRRVRRFALFFAQIFGIVSPKMMITIVRITVPIQVYLSFPLIRITSTDTSAEAPMFTRLLPIRMALRA